MADTFFVMGLQACKPLILIRSGHSRDIWTLSARYPLDVLSKRWAPRRGFFLDVVVLHCTLLSWAGTCADSI